MVKHGRRGRRKANARTLCDSTPPAPSSLAHSHTLITLSRWMKSNGAIMPNLVAAVFNDTGRGLMSRKRVTPGMTLVKLPASLLITTNIVLESYLGPLIQTYATASECLTPTEALCLYLLYEKQKGAASFWHPYIQSLPITYTNATYWSEDELHLLPFHIACRAREQITSVEQSFVRACKLHDYVVRLQPHLDGALSMNVYRWAWSTVNTRSVYLSQPPRPCFHDNKDDMALAPYLDLLNHSAHIQVKAGLNKETCCYEIVAEYESGPYSQAFISYGPHDNARLLIDYGFILPSNPHNVVPFTLEDILPSLVTKACQQNFVISNSAQKHKFVKAQNLNHDLFCNVEGLSWNLSCLLKILASQSSEGDVWKSIIYKGRSLSTEEENTFAALTKILLGSHLIDMLALLNKCTNLKVIGKEQEEHICLARSLTSQLVELLQKNINMFT